MHLTRRLRALLIAGVVVALSAGIAVAAYPPTAAQPGLANAASHAGRTVPTGPGAHPEAGGPDASAHPEASEGADENAEASDAEDGGDHCATDPRTLTPEQLAQLNHGAIVCWAAHQTSWPSTFANKGAWVSSWAHTSKGTHGQGQGHGHGSGQANGHGQTGDEPDESEKP